MPTVYITRKTHFNAAHRLHNPARSEAWNRETFGTCNSPTGHRHNYTLEIVVAGEPDPETGYVIDLGVLKRIVEQTIIAKFDHKNLNLEVDFMDGIIPPPKTSPLLSGTSWRTLCRLVGSLPFGSSRPRTTGPNTGATDGIHSLLLTWNTPCTT